MFSVEKIEHAMLEQKKLLRDIKNLLTTLVAQGEKHGCCD